MNYLTEKLSWMYTKLKHPRFLKFLLLGVIMTVIGTVVRWFTYDLYNITVLIVEPILVGVIFVVRYLIGIIIGVIRDD